VERVLGIQCYIKHVYIALLAAKKTNRTPPQKKIYKAVSTRGQFGRRIPPPFLPLSSSHQHRLFPDMPLNNHPALKIIPEVNCRSEVDDLRAADVLSGSKVSPRQARFNFKVFLVKGLNPFL
jgi:hypothetical protein